MTKNKKKVVKSTDSKREVSPSNSESTQIQVTMPELIQNFAHVAAHAHSIKDPHVVKMRELTEDLLYYMINGEFKQ